MTYQFTNDTFVVESDKVTYTQDAILSNYMYETSEVIRNGTSLTVRPKKKLNMFLKRKGKYQKLVYLLLASAVTTAPPLLVVCLLINLV
jgi:hypothetical protein